MLRFLVAGMKKSPSLKSIPPRPSPLAEFDDACREEWERICDEVEAVGHPIRTADRSLLVTYCRVWSLHRATYRKLQQEGAVIEFSNGNKGMNPEYKVFKEMTQQLRGLLADLGATPASRDFDVKIAAKDEAPAEIDLT